MTPLERKQGMQPSLNRLAVTICGGLVGFLLSMGNAHAIKDPAGAIQEREQVRQQIKSLSEAIQKTTDERAKTEKLVDLLGKRLEQTQQRLETLDDDRQTLEKDIAELEKAEKQLQADLADTEARVAQNIRNQYKRQDINPTQTWLAGKSASEAAREGYWFERLSQAEKQLAREQAEQSLKLASTREGLEKKRESLKKTIDKQKQRERELSSQRSERRELVSDLASKLKDQELTKTRLSRDEKRLSGLIEDLNKAIEAARARQAQAKTAPKTNKPKPNKVEPSDAPFVPANGDFGNLKGKLRLPVDGKVTGKFGDTRDAGGSGPAWKGIFIEAIEGKAVQAVAEGRIVFSEWLRGFGELVIIDHGDNYLSVYGNNDKLLKQAGDAVKAGEKIAEVGNSSGNLETGLYFELRHQGRPFDPLSWSAK